MVARNLLIATVVLGMNAMGIAVTGRQYSACPQLATENQCMCSEGKITILGKEGAMESCISFLQGHQPLKFRELHVFTLRGNLSLPQNWLGDTQFDSVFIYEANVIGVDANFLGASADTIRNLTFRGGSLNVFPKVNSSSLEKFSTEGTKQLSDLPGDAFQHTPQLKAIELKASSGGPAITMHSGALSGLSHLESVVMRNIPAVDLLPASASITSPFFKTLDILGTVTIAPGALSGFPPGSELVVERYDGLWSQEIFYNFFLSGGPSMRTRDAQACECDMAWLRYSSFLDQVDGVRCYTGFYPASPRFLDFLDCTIRDLDQQMLQNCY
ncbi:hypothetical protein FHG87_008812 [Trinorchestia longiramus]|nr:hypothetical protein FHG87_008812 [Trinorchestia longiramus]